MGRILDMGDDSFVHVYFCIGYVLKLSINANCLGEWYLKKTGELKC